MIEKRIYDMEKPKLSNSNKCILYQHLIEYYLTNPINHIFKRYITMFRISEHISTSVNFVIEKKNKKPLHNTKMCAWQIQTPGYTKGGNRCLEAVSIPV